jgi:3-methylfumaryl-CoA hydratase
MTDAPVPDIDHLKTWIGRAETARDRVSPRLARELAATLDHDGPEPKAGEPAPLAVHWCLAPPAARQSALGPDGHPERGGFLPPVPLPRRMWAGSALVFHDRLRVGDAVERRSRIAEVALKEGRTGPLCFVAVDHELWTDRGLAVAERHDIVYRGPAEPRTAPAAPAAAQAARWSRAMTADPVLLFRYSALTFNGHRIHYDRTYATEVEGYPGLIVHGPLQATLLLEFAASIRGAAPTTFRFRGLTPLFDGRPFRLCADGAEDGLALWIADAAGARTVEARASWS